jgi:hypothetical protein
MTIRPEGSRSLPRSLLAHWSRYLTNQLPITHNDNCCPSLPCYLPGALSCSNQGCRCVLHIGLRNTKLRFKETCLETTTFLLCHTKSDQTAWNLFAACAGLPLTRPIGHRSLSDFKWRSDHHSIEFAQYHNLSPVLQQRRH